MGDEVVRPLSAAERWFWLIDQLSPANCVVRLRVRGPVGAYRLEEAANAVVAEFPLLRAVVTDGPSFVTSADPHLPVLHRIVTDPDEWHTVFDDQLGTPIDLSTAPGRLIDLAWRPGTSEEHHDLILVLSHVLLDGRSMTALGWRILAYAFGEEPPAMSRPPIPAPDDLIPAAHTRLSRCLRANLAGQLTAVVRRATSLPAVLPPLPIRRTRTVIRTIEGAQLAALRARCQQEGVTVNAALAAALAGALGDLARPRRSGVAGIGIPVDVRSRLHPAPDDDEPGMFTAVVPTFVPYGPEKSLWDAARTAKGQLSQRLTRSADLASLAAIRYGCPRTLESGRRAIELIDRRAPWNVTLSNLGRLAQPETPEPLHISTLTVAGTNPCASALTVAVATLDTTLSITFCYVDTMLEHATIETLADDTVAPLARGISDPVTTRH
ncbi:phthiocerol/phthiodiolone dimycocerosyl transferase family protein [Nocardia mangyaensis]|uniref:phthiocerol/phthiodiolone dimycocerosyl transferase family protein n=1 Tax=Nocardia mangyaensis TaxID=2213200 RepID=UPI002675B0CB|nr:condensation domain-containing protein [Nocardia mangyaensis]MDO3645483.1 condensation domain-containing protein [Nocardia mangyaensis]